LYAKKLEASGVATEYHCRADMFHGFISFAGALAQGIDEIYRTADFFRARTGK
jgi:acetyl esterase/lipase